MFRNVDHAIRFAYAMREIPVGKFCNLASLSIGLGRNGELVAEMLPGGYSDMDPHDWHAQAGLIWTRLYGGYMGSEKRSGLPSPLRDFVTVQYGWGQVRAVSMYGVAKYVGSRCGSDLSAGLMADIVGRASDKLRGLGQTSRSKIAQHHQASPKTVRWWEEKAEGVLMQLYADLERALGPEWEDRGLIEAFEIQAA
ncbi:hypothetical protein [Chitinimonas naiadis]